MLRDYLQKQFPFVLVPPISDPINTKRKEHDWAYTLRMSVLEKFLNRILNCDYLKGSAVVFDFLTEPDEKKLSRQLKNHAERVNKPTTTAEYSTITGKLPLTTEPSSFIFCKKFNAYIMQFEIRHQEFHSLS